jgi:hypothetical protein
MTRPTNIFNKTRRRTKSPVANKRAYKRQSVVEYEQAIERLKFGSLGAASPVRKIDPATGAVMEILKPSKPNPT